MRAAFLCGLLSLLALGCTTPAPKPTKLTPTVQIDKQAQDALCQDTPHRSTCLRICIARPATTSCLIARQFGPGALGVLKALKPGDDVRVVAKKQGLPNTLHDPLAWALHQLKHHSDPDDPTSPKFKPTISPQSQQKTNKLQRQCRTHPNPNARVACNQMILGLLKSQYINSAIPEAISWMTTASAYTQLRKTRQALDAYQKARQSLANGLPSKHPMHGRFAINLGVRLLKLPSPSAQAIGLKWTDEGITHLKNFWGPIHPEVDRAYYDLAQSSWGRHPQQALRFIKASIKQRQRLFGDRSTPMARALFLLGKVHGRLFDRAAQIAVLKQSRALFVDLKGEDDLHVARVEQFLGYAIGLDKPKQGEPMLRHSIEVLKAKGSNKEDTIDLAWSHGWLAQILVAQKRFDDAIEQFLQSAKLHRSVRGPMSGDGAQMQYNAGFAYALKRDYAKAINMMEAARRIYARIGHRDNPRLLFKVYMAHNDDEGARRVQRQAFKQTRLDFMSKMGNSINTTITVESLWHIRNGLDDHLSAFARKEDHATMLSHLLNWQSSSMRVEQQAHRNLQKLRKLSKQNKNPRLFLRWLEQQRLAEQLLLKANTAQRRQNIQTQLDQLNQKQVPTLQSSGALPHERFGKVDYPTLCKRLNKSERNWIHFVKYRRVISDPKMRFGVRIEPTYDAFVVHPKGRDCDISRSTLGQAKPIEDALKSWRKSIRRAERCFAKRGNAALCSKSFKGVDQAASTVGRLIWTPIEGQLGKLKQSWVITDGQLNTFALGTIPHQKGYLIESHQLDTLAYPAALLHPKSTVEGKGALVIGDLDYNTTSTKPNWKRCQKGTCQPGTPTTSEQATMRKSTAPCGQGATWSSLGKTEALPVAQLLSKQLKQDALLIQGADATKATLLKSIANKRVLHLATHGFFAKPKACIDHAKIKQEVGAGKQLTVPRVDHLRLSAVVLSGANAIKNKGVLSARDVSQMDLRGTQLVVLSACETARGTVIDGEGVMGLTRAFLIAGAHHTVASLWRVPSQPTSALFGSMYPKLLATRKQLSAPAALRQAQLEMIKRARKQNTPHSAFLWGAFISVGRGE